MKNKDPLLSPWNLFKIDVQIFWGQFRRGLSEWLAKWWLVAVVLLALGWVGPRAYEPEWIEPDIYDSRRIWVYKRHWFGATTETELRARRNGETWVWMCRAQDGSWYPYFQESLNPYEQF